MFNVEWTEDALRPSFNIQFNIQHFLFGYSTLFANCTLGSCVVLSVVDP
jgi:hypothetical protein